MWTFLIIVIVIAGIILYVKFLAYIDYQRYLTEYDYVFKAHEKIGYPTLTRSEQFDILDNENMQPILKLTEYDFVPTGLLNYYLNIDPDQYFEHLKSLNLKEKIKFTDIKDGFYIKETDRGFEYLFIDRNSIVSKKKFPTYERLLNYIVYDKLNLYAPKKYKNAWLKKYFV
jgi:hypothetical protein